MYALSTHRLLWRRTAEFQDYRDVCEVRSNTVTPVTVNIAYTTHGRNSSSWKIERQSDWIGLLQKACEDDVAEIEVSR